MHNSALPSGWLRRPLGAVARAQYGTSAPATESGSCRVVGMSHIAEGTVLLDDLPAVDLGREEIDILRLRKGDLLFNRTNSFALVGKVGVVASEPTTPTVFASYIVRLQIDEAMSNGRYLGYFLSLNDVVSRIKAFATPGVSQFNVNPTTLLRHLRVILPPPPEQIEICRVLEQWDKGIARVGRLLKARRKLKRGLLQQLLTGQRRFPEFRRTDEWVQTRYGTYPKDWDITTIGSVASESTRRASERPDSPVLSCTKHHGLVSSAEYFGRRVHSEDTGDYRLVRRGDFAYATNHIEEGSIGLLSDREAGLVSPMYTVFEVGGRVHAPFLIALLKTEHYRQMYQARTNASVDRRGGLRWDEFAKIPLALPSLEEQARIAMVLAECDRELLLLKQLHDALKEQKKGLMQKLLTGQVRVPASMLKEANYA